MIGVIGLGLIGGSMAKALNQSTDNAVYGFDTNPEVVQRAKLVNAIEEELTPEMIPLCDLVIIALYPEATREVLTKYAGAFKKNAIVMDTCGVKGTICPVGEQLAKENGFYFIGGHPMAGLEHSGFEYARKALFSNASMILVPPTGTPIAVVDRHHNARRTRPDDRLHFAARACRLERVHQEPDRGEPRWLLGGQLQGPDPRRQTQRRHVDRALPREPGQPRR